MTQSPSSLSVGWRAWCKYSRERIIRPFSPATGGFGNSPSSTSGMVSREKEGCQRRILASGMTSGGLRLARKSCGERKTEENHSRSSESKQLLRRPHLPHLVMVLNNLYQVLVKLLPSFDEKRATQTFAPFLFITLLLAHPFINISLNCQLELFVLLAVIVSRDVFLLTENEC